MRNMTPAMQKLVRDFLQTFHIFKNFPIKEIPDFIQGLQERRFEAREVIFKEGERADSCFFIVSGKVAMLKHNSKARAVQEHLGIMGSGRVIGQLSMIDGQPRSSSCVAMADSLLLELSREDFDALVDKGDVFAFMFKDFLTRSIIRQLRQANEKLASLVKLARTVKTAPVEQIGEKIMDIDQSTKEVGLFLDSAEAGRETINGFEKVEKLYNRQLMEMKDRVSAEAAKFPTATEVDWGEANSLFERDPKSQAGRKPEEIQVQSRDELKSAILQLSDEEPTPKRENVVKLDDVDLEQFGISIGSDGSYEVSK